MTPHALLLLMAASASVAVPPPLWLFPEPSRDLQPPPPSQAAASDASGDIAAPSWADILPAAAVPAQATATTQSGEIVEPSWADVLPPPEPSEELQPPPAPAPASGVFPADPEGSHLDILRVVPRPVASTAPSGPAEEQPQEQPIVVFVQPTSNEINKETKTPAPASKQSLLKQPTSQFPKKYRPELHKAEGGSKKKINPKPQVPEQETAESGFSAVAFGAGGHSIGGDHLGDGSHVGGGERVEFQMHGHHGPNSYKFGFDTGNVHNRQFRYEERDAHGHVKGHYGFYDKHGKLQIVNYSADPHTGYHAEPGH